MKRILACVLGILLLSGMGVSAAEGPVTQEEEVALLVRQMVAADPAPRQVAKALAERRIRFVGFQQKQVTFAFDGKGVQAVHSRTTTVGPDLVPQTQVEGAPPDSSVMAGEKADLTLTMWLYEWRLSDGSYREQAMVNGYWSSTEYSWIDDPDDVIDMRWIVGDLVYLSSTPFDGVQRDQHTHGIASFTVNDQISSWDLFVNFRPVSSQVYGRWTNVFLNYTHTWWSRGQTRLNRGRVLSTRPLFSGLS